MSILLSSSNEDSVTDRTPPSLPLTGCLFLHLVDGGVTCLSVEVLKDVADTTGFGKLVISSSLPKFVLGFLAGLY
jgi:hypothetical protein